MAVRGSERVKDGQRNGAVPGVAASIVGLARGIAKDTERVQFFEIAANIVGVRVSEGVIDEQRIGAVSSVAGSIVGPGGRV